MEYGGRRDPKTKQADQRQRGLADQRADTGQITARDPAEAAVERVEGAGQRSARLALGPQDHGAQRGAEREGVEGREQHRSRDGERELAVNLAADSAQKRNRDEYRG